MEALKQALRSGTAHRWLVVVPRGIAMMRLRRELTDELGHLFGLRITTLRGMIESFAFRLPDPLPRTISQLAAEEALGGLASGLAKSPLSGLLQKPSAQRVALATIRELKTAGVKRGDLAGAGDEKLRAVTALWTAYDKFCALHGLIDPADRELAAIRAVEAGSAGLQGCDDLLVTGFVSFPAHHQRLLKALARTCRLHLHLPSDGGRTDLFSDNAGLLRGAETWTGAATQPPSAQASDPAAGEGIVGKLQRRLFAPLAEPLEHDPARIRIAAAPRRYDEVEAVGCRIIELLEKGVAPGRIGVTMRDLAEYDSYIRDVFGRLEIPLYYRRGIPILQAPPVKLALKLAELGGARVRYDELLGLLRSPYLKLESAEVLADNIIKAGIYAEKPERWVGRLAGVSDSPPDGALVELERLLADCLALRRAKGNRLSRFEKLARAYVRIPGDDGSSIAKRDRDGWDKFLEVLDDLAGETGELERLEIAPAVDPLERLRERLRQESIPAYRDPADSVYVLNFFDMGYVAVDYLFVIGMAEGLVPGGVGPGKSLLSDSDIRSLREKRFAGAAELRDSADLRRTEEQAFLRALCAARKVIELSYPLLKANGKETSPSPYLAEIQAILGIQELEPDPLPGGDIRRLEQVPPYRLALQRQIARRLFRSDLPESDPLVLPAYDRLLGLAGEREALRRFLDVYLIEEHRLKALLNSPEGRRAVANRYCGRIEADDLRCWIADRFGPEYRWSVNSLEKMGACPFDFFLSYCLGLEELRLPEEEPPPLDEGSLLHAIAREFVASVDYPIGDVESARRAMDAIIESHFQSAYPSKAEEPPLPVMVMRRRIAGMMSRFIKYESEKSGWLPLKTEYSFGTRDEPLVLPIGTGGIKLTGRFDRVDESSERAGSYQVIDYKRGSAITSFAPSLKGHNLQMPVYIIAAGSVLGVSPAQIKGGFYTFRDGKWKEIEPDAATDFRDWRYFLGLSREPCWDCKAYAETEPKTLVELVEELVTQARGAYFPVEGRNGAQVPSLPNFVGRWLEVPPEFEAGGEE